MAAKERDLNRDPLTGESGAHPVGTGVGATGGAVAGAAVGIVGGPIGAAVGGVIGAVVGGLAGKAAAEVANPTIEEAHWRDNYTKEPYYKSGQSFEDYAPAYKHGQSGRTRYTDDWDTVEPQLASEWESARGSSPLDWQQAKPASRAAWDRGSMLQAGSGIGGGSGAAMGTGAGMRSGFSANGSYAPSRDLDALGGGSVDSMGSSDNGARSMKFGEHNVDRDEVVEVLQDLVECCKDGEYGFQACAEQADRQDLKSLFRQRAGDCRRSAQELNQHIVSLGGDAEDGGSALGAVHRGWVSVKTTFTSYDDLAVLEEAERGEDNALARYRKALKANLSPDMNRTVENQLQGVQRNYEQIRTLRDQFESTS